MVLVSHHQTEGFPSLQTTACSKTLGMVARPKASEMVATNDILDFATRISVAFLTWARSLFLDVQALLKEIDIFLELRVGVEEW
jgi:hypothetical protein